MTDLKDQKPSYRYPGNPVQPGNAGISRLTILVFLPIVAALIYTANAVAPFYYNYFELQNQMHSLIRVAAVHTDAELLKKLETHIKWLEMPIAIEDVVIQRYANSMRMSVQYQETFWFTWQDTDYEIYTFNFDATVEDDF